MEESKENQNLNAVIFEAFRTIEPASTFASDPTFEVIYTAKESFTVLVKMNIEIEKAWNNENTLTQIIQSEKHKFGR